MPRTPSPSSKYQAADFIYHQINPERTPSPPSKYQIADFIYHQINPEPAADTQQATNFCSNSFV